MYITQALLGEHGVLYALISHLEQTLPHAASVDQLQTQVALMQSALATHANLENSLLFESLERQGGPAGPLEVMRREHEEIEQALELFPRIYDLDRARQAVHRFVPLVRDHFAKEEQILFPLAEQVLDAATLSRLGLQWAEQRGVETALSATQR